MKVTYDRNLRVAGIGLVPWTRLGPEIWLDNYKIASLHGWDIDLDNAPKVHSLTSVDPTVNLPKLTSQAMLNNSTFQNLLLSDFTDYKFLTYKPVIVPAVLRDAKLVFLSPDSSLSKKLENKAYFRRHFTPLGIPIPSYKIYKASDIKRTAESLSTILDKRKAVVLQDAALSGGKGTYIVSDLDSLNKALDSIEMNGSSGTYVVSQKIEHAYERTVQCVVTRYGTFVGPLQKQIVAHPLLANLDVANGDKFCGAEISNSDVCAESYEAIKGHALAIGDELFKLGYRGIFGLDCLVEQDGTIHVLEVNPRITGVTPLLTMLYRKDKDIPFYLLHILELVGADYEITDMHSSPQTAEGSLLMLHTHAPRPSRIAESPSSGLYSPALHYIEPALRFDQKHQSQVLVQQYTPPNFTIKPGGRLLSVFVNHRVMNDDDTLTNDTKTIIERLNNMVRLEQL